MAIPNFNAWDGFSRGSISDAHLPLIVLSCIEIDQTPLASWVELACTRRQLFVSLLPTQGRNPSSPDHGYVTVHESNGCFSVIED